ncbi:MAG: hypothetical protein J5I50_13275 [Chitinophagaceae bacterium]|nr:hypothetical protein [Chitinophagaceae bacterium]
MKIFFSICALLFILAQDASAKIWRVNNNLGINADFTDLPAAVSAAAAGDTIMVEASSSLYTAPTLTKKLIIIGTGYYFTDATPNPKTQANTNVSGLSGNITFNAGSSGSVVEGLTVGGIFLNESDITVERNNITSYMYIAYAANSVCNNDTIRQNVVYGLVSGSSTGKATNLLVYNNIFNGPPVQFASNVNNISGYFINNDFLSSYSSSCANFTFQNNIFYSANFGAYLSSNAFFNNLTTNTGLPTGNGNQLNVNLDNVFVGYSSGTGFSSDGRYQLKNGSPASGAGLLNGGTVDCGAFGAPAPYILSGMPAIPSIYVLTVPSSVPSGATNMNVSISSTTVH